MIFGKDTTHWTAAMMAKAVGISASFVRRIWRAHGLQPHRVKQFKLCLVQGSDLWVLTCSAFCVQVEGAARPLPAA
jgi:hypothetical protein